MAHGIIVDTVRYQRNGSMGEGFFAVSFRIREGRVWTPMVATVHTDSDDTFLPKRTAVICPSRPRETWDGLDFAPSLIECCKASQANGSAFSSGPQIALSSP